MISLAIMKDLLPVILKVSIFVALVGFAAHFMYQKGVDTENARWEQKMLVMENKLESKTNRLIELSHEYVKTSTEATTKSEENIKAILDAGYGKPVVVYKEGKCNLTDDFKNSFNSIIKEANKK